MKAEIPPIAYFSDVRSEVFIEGPIQKRPSLIEASRPNR